MRVAVHVVLALSVAVIASAQDISFSDIDYLVRESTEYVTIDVVTSQPFSDVSTVTVRTRNITAFDGMDYSGGEFTVTFPVNETQVSFNITIINDDEPPLEGDEQFRVNFVTVPSGATAGEFATVTIRDDCTRECQNGGTLDSNTCVCTCPADYTGLSCETPQNVSRSNDTIIGDPLYEVPVIVDEEGNKVSLCYEVRGEANQTFNLISDTCVSVNALYSPMNKAPDRNFISKIGVLAEDNNGECQQIEADFEGCTARVDGQVQMMYNQDGVRVMRRTNRIRISVPNCENIDLVMWVICEVREGQSLIKFVVARGFNLRPTSHGLIGQFWNIKVEAEKYNVTAEDKIAPGPDHYAVTVRAPSGTRRFLAQKAPLTWDQKSMSCLYCGHAQGGNLDEVASLSDSVIQGTYDEYKVNSLFDPEYSYTMFRSQCM